MSALFDIVTGRVVAGNAGVVFGPLGMAAGLVGTAISAASTISAGQNAQALGNYEAAQHIQDSMLDTAFGQRKMLDQQYKDKFIQSQLVARAAGSGLDPSIGSPNVLSQQIAGRGTYNALSDLAQGQARATTQENLASGARYQGDLAESQVPLQLAGTIAGGAGSFFSQGQKLRYWG